MRRAPLLLALTGVGACVSVVPWEPPEPTPPASIDDDDSEDPGPASLDVVPSQVEAGAVVDVELVLQGYGFGSGAGPCCSEPDVVVLGPGETPTQLRFFFGLLADGERTWGLAGPSGTVLSGFEVAGGEAPPVFEGGSADVSLAAPRAWQAWRVDIDGPNKALAARVRDPAAPFFRPRLWALASDGATRLAVGGQRNGEDNYGAPRLVTPVEPGAVYLRVDDADLDGGAGYAGVIEIAVLDWPEPVLVAEQEPNDEVWQPLGSLGPGSVLVTGATGLSGHARDNQPTGDLDVFTFSLDAPARVLMDLQWPDPTNDLDALLFDNRGGAAQLGFDSPDGIQERQMASLDRPEQGEFELEAGVEYAVLVFNWFGLEDAQWTLHIDVRPDPWAAE